MTATLICLIAIIGLSGELPMPNEKEVSQILGPFFQEQAKAYEFFLDAAHRQKLELVEKPVMRWTAEGNFGAVWVWTRQGRAEAVGCLGAYLNSDGKLEEFHEFHSLTLKPLQPVKIGTVRSWESSKPGVEPRLMADADKPAATDKLRLIQMRNLAREFTVEIGVQIGPTSGVKSACKMDPPHRTDESARLLCRFGVKDVDCGRLRSDTSRSS